MNFDYLPKNDHDIKLHPKKTLKYLEFKHFQTFIGKVNYIQLNHNY